MALVAMAAAVMEVFVVPPYHPIQATVIPLLVFYSTLTHIIRLLVRPLLVSVLLEDLIITASVTASITAKATAKATVTITVAISVTITATATVAVMRQQLVRAATSPVG
jgi:hypothetical protein